MKGLYFSLIVLFLFSCSPKYPVYDSIPTGNDVESPYRHLYVENNGLQMQLSYIADGGDYLIYELWATEADGRTVLLSHEDVVMFYDGRLRADTTRAINPAEFIQYLETINEDERYAKKSDNVGLAILGGLSILSYALSPEASAIGVAAIGLDYALSSVENNAWRNDRIKSIENEIDYFTQTVLYEEIIHPGDTLIQDVLFKRTQVPLRPVTIQVMWDGESYFFDFTIVER